jgi:excisionase family DNA binding protein
MTKQRAQKLEHHRAEVTTAPRDLLQMNAHQPITATVSDFSRLTGLGRSTIYALLGDRRLDSIKVGKRRLIVLDSYRRLIEGQRGAASENGKPEPASGQTVPPRRGRPRRLVPRKPDNAPPGKE